VFVPGERTLGIPNQKTIASVGGLSGIRGTRTHDYGDEVQRDGKRAHSVDRRCQNWGDMRPRDPAFTYESTLTV